MALLKFVLRTRSWPRALLCRLVFLCILGSLIYGWISQVLVHQLLAPAVKFPFLDPLYWLAHLMHLPEEITSVGLLSWLIDIAMFALSLVMIVNPRLRLPAAAFFVVYLMYFVIFNSYGGHHTLNKAGILLMPLAFAVNRSRFPAVWDALRYYLVFIFSCAFFWKLIRLSWLSPEQGEAIVRKNLAPYLYFNPATPLATFYRTLLANPGLLYALSLTGFVMEGAFLLGFFTRKYDGLLFLLFLALVAGFWFTADAFFAELLIFALTFLQVDRESALKH